MMGGIKRTRKKLETPGHPYDKVRLERELPLVGNYGLRNKRELWKARTILSTARQQARGLLALDAEIRENRERELLSRLSRFGMLPPNSDLDSVLGLDVKVVLERRLQTLVFRKGLATSPYQARQFIVHRHIAIGTGVATSPGRLITVAEEDLINYAPRSPMMDQTHPSRPQAPPVHDGGQPEKKERPKREDSRRDGKPQRRDGKPQRRDGKPGAKPEAKSKPGAKPEVKPKPGAKPEVKPKPEVKKEEVKPEVKKEAPKKDVKPEVKKEAKPEVKPIPEVKKEEPKKEVKPEVKKEEPKKEAKPEVKPKPEVKKEVKPAAKKEAPKKPAAKKEEAQDLDISLIKGIGAKTAMLLKENGFDTVGKIAKATSEELAKVPGVGPATATAMNSEAKVLLSKKAEEKK